MESSTISHRHSKQSMRFAFELNSIKYKITDSNVKTLNFPVTKANEVATDLKIQTTAC